MNDQTPEPAGPQQPAPDPDAADTTVQPAAAVPASRNRFAWVSSPKVAAATVITVLALGALGGAFALGRATAGDDHGDRIMVRFPGGFDRRGPGMPGGDGWVERGGPGFHEHFEDGPAPQAPDATPTPSPSGSSSSKG